MTTLYHSYAQLNRNGDLVPHGVSDVRSVVVELDIPATALAAADVWKFVTFGPDVLVYHATLELSDLDTGTPALTVDLGYDLASGTDDDDYWLANSTIGQGGGTATSTAAVFGTTVNYTVQAKVEVAAATAAAGTAKLTLLVGPRP